MSWKLVYLLISIVCLIAGVWRLARGGNIFIVLTGFVWFFTVLFLFYLPDVYNFVLIEGVPTLGKLLHYIALPILIILIFYSVRERRS